MEMPASTDSTTIRNSTDAHTIRAEVSGAGVYLDEPKFAQALICACGEWPKNN